MTGQGSSRPVVTPLMLMRFNERRAVTTHLSTAYACTIWQLQNLLEFAELLSSLLNNLGVHYVRFTESKHTNKTICTQALRGQSHLYSVMLTQLALYMKKNAPHATYPYFQLVGCTAINIDQKKAWITYGKIWEVFSPHFLKVGKHIHVANLYYAQLYGCIL